MNHFTFGPDSNIVVQAPDDLVEAYNRVSELKHQKKHSDISKEDLPSYTAVVSLIGKKSMELYKHGKDPVRGVNHILVQTEPPEKGV
nr:MAG TPA: hypothetical protein [Caudoviricetes sp.]